MMNLLSRSMGRVVSSLATNLNTLHSRPFRSFSINFKKSLKIKDERRILVLLTTVHILSGWFWNEVHAGSQRIFHRSKAVVRRDLMLHWTDIRFRNFNLFKQFYSEIKKKMSRTLLELLHSSKT